MKEQTVFVRYFRGILASEIQVDQQDLCLFIVLNCPAIGSAAERI